MGLFGIFSGSVYEPLVEKATSEANTTENWVSFMEICDRVIVESTGAKECFRSILRRLNSPIPRVQMQCLTLIEALVANCGKKFHLEVCSRDFVSALRNLIGTKAHPKVAERARLLIKKWAKEFKNDPQLSLMPWFFEKLRAQGVSFDKSDLKPSRIADRPLKNQEAVNSAKEQADILKAIELSLSESQKKCNPPAMSSLYPMLSPLESSGTFTSSSQLRYLEDPVRMRALYDFEAVENNELTFKAGEIILVHDKSNPNWWKGSNHRGEGLFPANFVSTDLSRNSETVFKTKKKVQFSEQIKSIEFEEESQPNSTVTAPAIEIDESRIDRLLHLFNEADPQIGDLEELLSLEEQCISMMPLIDQQIELIDNRNTSLTELNQQLNSALNLYHELMKDSFMMNQAAGAATAAFATIKPFPLDQMPPEFSGYAHPKMASQISQPARYDPRQMAAAEPQTSAIPFGQFYLHQQPNFGYPQPAPPQPMTEMMASQLGLKPHGFYGYSQPGMASQTARFNPSQMASTAGQQMQPSGYNYPILPGEQNTLAQQQPENTEPYQRPPGPAM